MSEAGEIIGRIKLDGLDGYLADIETAKTETESLGAVDPKITVKADTAGAIAQLTATKSAVDDVSKAEARVAAARSVWERSTNQATIAEMRLDAVRKNGRASTIQVATATEAYRYANEKATSADERLAAAEVALAEARKRNTVAAVEEAAATDKAKQSAINWRGALIGGLIGVSAAAPPVAAAAVGITGAFAVMAGAGVLGLAGIVRGMKEGNDVGRQYKGTVDSLRASFYAAEDAGARGLFPGVQQSATFLAQQLPTINGEVQHFAGMLGAMLPTGLDAVVTLVERANPLFDAAGGYLQRIVSGLDNWAHGSGYQDFLDYSIKELPNVERFLGDTMHLVGDFITAWAPLGSDTLPLLDGLVVAVDDLVKRTGPLVPAAIAVAGAWQLLSPVAGMLSTIVGWTKNLGTEAVVAAGEVDVLAAAEERAAAAGGGVGAAGGAKGLLGGAKGLAAAAGVGAGLAIGDTYETTDASSQLLAQSSKTQGVAGRAGGAPGIDAALSQMVKSGDAAKAAAQFKQVQAAATALGISTTKLAGDFPKYTAAVTSSGKASATAGQATRGAIPPVTGLTAALSAQTPITASLTAAQKAEVLSLRSVAEGFRSTMSAAELLGNSYDDVTITQGNLIQSFQAQAKASKTGKVSLDENTVAGATNAEQMRGAVDKIKAHADAINADGKHAAAARVYTLEHAKSLEEQAVKAGADKGKVDALVGSLVDVSKTHPVSKIDVKTAQAMSQLEALQNKLGELNGFTSWVYVNLGGTAAAAAGTAGQVARNAIYGRAYGGTIEGHADGGTVYGRGTAATDSVLRRLSVGEEVTSNIRGQADYWRPVLKAMNAGMSPAGVVRTAAAVAGAGMSQEHHVHVHVTGDDSALTQMMRVEVTQGAARQQARDERTQLMGWQGKGLLAAPTGA